ncbi:hypothetical protein [Oceanospirillum sediminis]|uniref:hypothetical protein n=1 Tax=Oceanospirillum sediminis TaxID=2760088 RepID=UPI001C726F1A|nr:hypothetical protein [Oceanospirillum sediminis]
MKLPIFVLFILTLSACSTPPDSATAVQACSSQLFSLVEEKVQVADRQGHGPDPGSSEWQSVVEFKLGIRGNSDIPPRDTEQWCAYINRHYIGG